MKNKSNISVSTTISELSNFLNIYIEPTINDAGKNLAKQEQKAFEVLQENQDLLIRKANKGNRKNGKRLMY